MAELRRRAKKRKDAQPPKNANTTGKKEAAEPAAEPENNTVVIEDETLWSVFSKHPLVQVTPFILLPYLVYTAYFYVMLQRPDMLDGIGLSLRPAVGAAGERQVLIVGAMSSGTVQVASDLHQLGLEVGHELADTSSNFVRDGTVSWFHGTRFLSPKPTIKAYAKLCLNHTDNMGFHPGMYRQSGCSMRTKWDNCWAKECLDILEKEWDCKTDCPTPFRSTLLQVRRPLHTVQSLVTKFCQGGLNGTTHPSFLKYTSALFPDHDYEIDNCIEATSHYFLEYNKAMLQAHADGSIDHVYQVETTSPCRVAELAGFVDSPVYGPNSDKVSAQCQPGAPATQLMESTKHKINVDLLLLTWEDFKGGMHGSVRQIGDTKLEKQLKALSKRLGYEE